MTLTLSGGGLSLPLYNLDQDQLNFEANLIQTSMFARDTDENLLVPLTASDDQLPTFEVNGERVASEGGYSNNPERALAEWVARFESFVDGQQSGYTLTTPSRSRTVGGMIRMASWERVEGAPHEVQCRLEFVRGRDFDLSFGGSSGPESVNPSPTATIAGQNMGVIQSNQVKREQNLMDINIPQFLPDMDLDDNLVLSTGGPVRTVNVEGTRWGSPGEINSFENALENRMGDMTNTLTYSEAFPGRTMRVAVNNFEPTRYGGEPRRLDYRLEMIEGMQIADILDDFDYDFSDALDGLTG